MQVSTIGLDIAKNVFQGHGIDGDEKVVIRKQLRRGLSGPKRTYAEADAIDANDPFWTSAACSANRAYQRQTFIDLHGWHRSATIR